MAAGLQRLFAGDKGPVSPAANADTPAASADATPAADPSPTAFRLVAPWHVRNARALIAAATVIALGGAAYATYQAWWLFNNPLDRAFTAPVAPIAPPTPITPAAVAPQPPPAAAASPSSAAPARPPLPPSGRTPITHTLREPAAAPVVPAPAVETARPARVATPGCTDGVAALGLCPAGPATEAR